MGHRQYFQIHDFHRADQLDFRLRDFFHHALCVRLLEQPVAVPDRLVRRVLADADAYHPYHPDGKDSISAEPRKSGPDRNQRRHLRGRYCATFYANRGRVEVHAIAAALLAHHRGVPAYLRDTDPLGQNLVRPTMGHVISESRDGRDNLRSGIYAGPPPRWTASGPKACVTGMSSIALTLTRGGSVAIQWTVSAMSSGVSASAPS